MLKLINLYIIYKVISDAEASLGSRIPAASQMVYINALIHHFKDKEATEANANAFTMFESDFRDYSKFKKNFEDLHRAGLVTIGSNFITFNNVWGPLMDRTQLDKSPVMTQGVRSGPASVFLTELKESETLIELCTMRDRVSRVNLMRLMESFVKEQDAIKKTYNNYSDCASHFSRWMPANADKSPKEKVKSTGHILGK